MNRIDWTLVEAGLDAEGYAVIPGLLAGEQADALATWSASFYRHLASVANQWNATLGTSYRYPETCEAGEPRRQRLGEGDHLPLQQCTGGDRAFPFKVVALLNEPGKDFQGGEFVMTERRPRMQSRPMVLPLHAGDVAIVCCTSRPIAGSRGYYRGDLKHAISRVRSGERSGLEL